MKNRIILFAACLTASVSMIAGNPSRDVLESTNTPQAAGMLLADDDTYDNVEARVTWPFSSVLKPETFAASPEEGFTVVNVELGDLELTGTGTGSPQGVTYIKLRPSGSTKSVRWVVKPARGLTFTPTKVSGNIQRFGTDAKDGVVVSIFANETSQSLGSFTAARNNKTQSEDKYGSESNYANFFEITLPEELQRRYSTTEEFVLQTTVGVNEGKEGGFANICIEGILNGTRENVARYSLTTASNPPAACSTAVSPAGTQFDEGTQVTVSATPNFGFHFTNWTDGSGKVVSEEESFVYTVTHDEVLTANFTQLETFRLDLSVEGGANDYMVDLSPAPTLIDTKKMYEEQTEVTLTAASNKILSFSHWSDGQTSNSIKVLMDKDVTLTAHYSATYDVIAGWDFIRKGNSSRAADFYTDDNDLDVLVMRSASGTEKGWLDKSQEAAGGYEGKPAAVAWQSSIGDFYWQTCVNVKDFTDIIVSSEMLYNYNAYTTYLVEFSLDGEEWTKAGSIHMEGTKRWTESEILLPHEADNQPKLFIRWIADRTSEIAGSSGNDGASITNIFIYGTHKVIDDGKAPRLESSVPNEGESSASANGRVVLTFDKKVQLTSDAHAVLDGKELALSVSGKNVRAEYSGLAYNTAYTFVLKAGSVADLSGNNILSEDIVIHFSTRDKSSVKKQLFDFIVPDDGTFKEAIAAADARKDKTSRFRIFVKKGSYLLPYSTTEFITNDDGVSLPNPITYLSSPYVSIIGESRDETVVRNELKDNTPSGTAYPIEGLHNVTVLFLNKTAANTYLQDITLRSGLNDACGRGEALEDNADKTILKNVCLYGYQDTYCSNNQNGRYYFEGGVIRGRTDYLCGKGDGFWNGVELRNCGTGGYITAPSAPRKYGYVFSDCVLTAESSGTDGTFTLGRPWGSGTPIALYVNTTMIAKPSAAGWSEMSGGWPKRFAEYNSRTAAGSPIDMSKRKTTFGDGHTNNPVLSAEEAAELTLQNVMGDSDGWDPTEATEQASAPEGVTLQEGMMTWDTSEHVLCWAVCKDGNVVDFTTTASYAVGAEPGVWTVRAANEMGGLSEPSAAVDTSVMPPSAAVSDKLYDLSGRETSPHTRGVKIAQKKKFFVK
ncbi:MAG: Ig-like domain-containing protein [Bacteroidaceae bacterium]|nr:Ig-like domain-containing protein [Bacteroidaceae bacterium]